uniref:Uncharacterized protein n=1 Tax=Janibacter limosus TaxID=53458 RepID=A0AC61U1P3_9MICO|nr:hypothetical protein [Janibacter limosus]
MSTAKTTKGTSMSRRGARCRSGTRLVSTTPSSSRACTPKAQIASRGVATTAMTKSNVARIFRCAGMACSHELP